jgi:hypothetical protein
MVEIEGVTVKGFEFERLEKDPVEFVLEVH